jgi:hypothetical protein
MTEVPSPLEPFVGKDIGHVGPFATGKDDPPTRYPNLVSHVFRYEFADSRRDSTMKHTHVSEKGVALRIEKTFNTCIERSPWTVRSAGQKPMKRDEEYVAYHS